MSALRPTSRAGALSRVKCTPSTRQSVGDERHRADLDRRGVVAHAHLDPGAARQPAADVPQQAALAELGQRLRGGIKKRLSALSCGG